MRARLRVAITLEQCWHRVPGGTASSTLEAVRALLAHTTLDLVGVSARHSVPPAAPWVPPVTVQMLALPRHLLYESWHALRRPSVEHATGPVDVIHATGVAVPPRSRPLVVTVHDLAFVHDPSHFTRNGVRFFRRAIDLTKRDADLVVVPSQSTLDDCVQHGFDRSRLRVVPWGIDVVRATATEVEAARRRHGIGDRYVFWTGTIEPRKNLPRLISAFAAAAPADVDLVLGGPKGWNEDIGRLTTPIRDRVRVTGFLDDRDLRALYAGAEVFCFPSIREGFGLPVLEAMAQGTPVVTSRGTATEEVVGDAGIVVDPEQVDDLATALADLLASPVQRAELGRRARSRATSFSWKRTAAGLDAVYREAAA